MRGNDADFAMTAAADIPIPLAATLLLLRDGGEGLEVVMITRHAESGFAAGALVFPGGRVDAADSDPAVLRCCRQVPGIEVSEMALRVAAIRESFEEAHVLLARARGGEALLTTQELSVIEDRLHARLGRAPHFGDLLADGSIELATDLLVPFAHWITPAGRPKRYDTYFFLAAGPAQEPRHDGREAVASIWISPSYAVAEAEAERMRLIFVTRLNLAKLGRSRTVSAALAAARADTIVTVCPQYVETAKGTKWVIPAAAGYGISELPARKVTLA
jgi:8-oxo-dGTP pyrophosphatase MutT (NUDIX family)